MPDNILIVVSITKIVILVGVVIGASFFIRRHEGIELSALTFFALGSACYMGTEVYYLSNLLLKESIRYPYFSADDIGSLGAFLLFASCLLRIKPQTRYKGKFLGLGFGFAFFNAIFYTYYGTDHLFALFYGVILGFFAVILLQRLADVGMLTKRRFYVLVTWAVFLCIFIIAEIISNDGIKEIFSTLQAVFFFVVIIWLLVRLKKTFKNKEKEAVFLSFSIYLVCIFTMYMTYDPWYSIADILSAFITIPILILVARIVKIKDCDGLHELYEKGVKK